MDANDDIDYVIRNDYEESTKATVRGIVMTETLQIGRRNINYLKQAIHSQFKEGG